MENIFGNNLRVVRIKSNLTQKELASKLNVSYKTLNHWELGYTEPNLSALLTIKEIFNISIDELLKK